MLLLRKLFDNTFTFTRHNPTRSRSGLVGERLLPPADCFVYDNIRKFTSPGLPSWGS